MSAAPPFPLVPALRRVLVLLLGALLLLGLLALPAGPASARGVGEGRHVRGVGAETSRGMWLGAIEAPANGEKRYPTFCTHMWRDDPEPYQTASLSTLVEAAQWGPDELDATTPQMAWILLAHQADASATNRAALAYLVHANFEAPDAGRDPADSVSRLVAAVRAQIPEVDALARTYVAEARASAAVAYANGEASGDGERHGRLSSIGVRSTNGWVSGRPVTARLDGPAVFTATGAAAWSGTTGNEPISLDWRATGNGEVRATLVYTDPARQTLTRYTTGPNLQDVVTIGDRPSGDAEEHEVAGPTWRVAYDFRPIATSNVGKAKILDAGPLTDVLAVSADPSYGSGDWLEIEGRAVPVVFRGTAYRTGEALPATAPGSSGPSEAGASTSSIGGEPAIPEGAEPLGTTTLTATGPGEYAASLALPEGAEPGFVTWVWRTVEEDQAGTIDEAGAAVPLADLIRADWADAFGLPDETTSLRFPIDVDSSLSTRTTKSGTYLVDDLFVTGFPSDHPAFTGGMGFEADAPTFTQSLLFFPEGLEVVDANREKAETIGSLEIPARNGFHPSIGATDFRIGERPGTYVFVSSFAGDSRVRPFASSVEDATEQYRVAPPEAPASTLETTATDADDGDKELPGFGTARIADRVCYSGLEAGAEYLLTGTLMDRESGEPVRDGTGAPVTVEQPLVPEAPEGCAQVLFEVEAARRSGRTTVVFERLARDGALVVAHADLSDEGQTVTSAPAASLTTTASDGADGDKTLVAGADARIVDRVCYAGLEPGREYSLVGTLMDRLLNAPVLADGAPLAIATTLRPETSDGCAEVTFALDASALAGRSLVVFEELRLGDALVAVHADIEDEGQTVSFEAPPAPESPQSAPPSSGPGVELAKTGATGAPLLGGALMLALIGAAALLGVRVRDRG